MTSLSDYFQFFPDFFDKDDAASSFDELLANTPWQQPSITVYGKTHPVPRLTAWYSDSGASYSYSGISHEPLPWAPELEAIKRVVEAKAACRFNSVLLNLYRDGNDSNGWHSDNEPELNHQEPIASVSLGASRRFRLRLKQDKSSAMGLDLPHNSLLLMAAGAQQVTEHCVPKTARPVEARINLTFRQIQT